MARGAGLALKTLQWFLRAVEFGCAAVILGLYSYFLARLSIANQPISNYTKSVEGIAGAAVIYTILAVLLVCCVGGLGFFALLAFILDIAFVGAFIYVAYETRYGANSCSGFVTTPVGAGTVGVTQTFDGAPSLRTACRMNTACFAVAIVAIVFFLISAFVEIALWRHHKSEKKYGPGPANNYSQGSGNRKFWQRRRTVVDPAMTTSGHIVEKNPNTLPNHATPADVRRSYATDNTRVGDEPVYNKYNTAEPTVPFVAGSQHTGLTGGHQHTGLTSGHQHTGLTGGHQQTGVTGDHHHGRVVNGVTYPENTAAIEMPAARY